jgi:hypothetical protein
VSELRNSSRKYKLALIALVLVTGGWIVSGTVPGLAQMFSELITGIMGILMLYFTGNVGNKFVVGKTLVEQTKAKGDINGSKQ